MSYFTKFAKLLTRVLFGKELKQNGEKNLSISFLSLQEDRLLPLPSSTGPTPTGPTNTICTPT